ncbi:uncharacterized protein LOC124420594 [Lucilia cuprina]|uniref:uncharacterized protein LOC124420594 n=1 Tax=Lucilia cuprina TaxID=7375 RepID=UPI001F05D263|nr:uncharacterized protein LOC124420594 [Lucilia cuprina]
MIDQGENIGGENENFENDTAGGVETNERERGRDTNESSTNECETNDRNIPQMMEKQDFEFLGNLLKKELEIFKREKELLRKENDLLKKIAMFEKTREDKTTENVTVDVNDNDTMSINASNDEGFNSNMHRNKLNASFGILKDYDGGLLPELWITQFKSVIDVYSVDENTAKALLMCKLRGKAQAWLHSKPNFIYESTEEILTQMKEIFCTKENKLMMRRKFEARIWKFGETFTDYYNDKIILANKVDVSDDELIDNIIEGIPDEQLRVQANLQCYTNKTQLLQAFF